MSDPDMQERAAIWRRRAEAAEAEVARIRDELDDWKLRYPTVASEKRKRHAAERRVEELTEENEKLRRRLAPPTSFLGKLGDLLATGGYSLLRNKRASEKAKET